VSIAKTLKQPLPYFVVIGVLAFLMDAWLRRESTVIHVTEGVRREVAAELASALSRPATAEEVEQGVRRWLETELLFREAMELGLDENDAVIRSHLARKLQQLAQQRTIVGTPTDGELQGELAANSTRYSKPDTFTVSHVFVNRSVSPHTYEARVKETLSQLEAGADVKAIGDHFPRGPRLTALTRPMLEGALGIKLGPLLTPEQQGKWHTLEGPRGTHFVRLDAVMSGQATLENSRRALVDSLQARAREDAAAAYVQELAHKFTVVYESER
jgi:hypothetical protein